MSLTPGDKLGPYEILAPLGAGGMGEVWKARDTRLGRLVAIKQLKADHSARFEQEARAIAALNHPHICQIFDIGPDYLVLEYIEGRLLRGPMAAEDAITLALQIAGALEEAHAHGILHCDLKPGNILLTAKGAKLLDFGLAKLTGDANPTQSAGVAGTPLYMSPEQAEGKALDARSDVFSFGAVLYEALAGSRAFDSLAAVLRDEPGTLEAPPALRAIVTRCLRKAPADRFPSAAELRAALQMAEGHSSKITAEQQPSIAVLPFANLSDDREQEYFSDGLAEEIINLLARIPGLQVTARTSSFAFRGKEQDVTKIAEALRVRTILEGSVRRAGNCIRVTVQLINAVDGYHLWSERYDRDLSDIFAVQDEISAAITAALEIRLWPAGMPRRRYQPTLPAYEAYLRARHAWGQATPKSFAGAQQGLELAMALDPGFALPYVFMGNLYAAYAVLGSLPAHEAFPQARRFVSGALELDPDLPEAHAYLGAIAMYYDYDWMEAERRFQRALACAPVSADTHLLYGVYRYATGRTTEGVEEVLQAVLADPVLPANRVYYAIALATAGRLPEAIDEMHKLCDPAPSYWPAQGTLSMLYWLQGDRANALMHAASAYESAPWNAAMCGLYAGGLAATGLGERAAELMAKLPHQAYGTPWAFVLYHHRCGEMDVAAEWFAKAIKERSPRVFMGSLLGPEFCSGPRWARLAGMMHLPQVTMVKSALAATLAGMHDEGDSDERYAQAIAETASCHQEVAIFAPKD
jgi:TolB-like protein/predicted Ser/Thr protein kinase